MESKKIAQRWRAKKEKKGCGKYWTSFNAPHLPRCGVYFLEVKPLIFDRQKSVTAWGRLCSLLYSLATMKFGIPFDLSSKQIGCQNNQIALIRINFHFNRFSHVFFGSAKTVFFLLALNFNAPCSKGTATFACSCFHWPTERTTILQSAIKEIVVS